MQEIKGVKFLNTAETSKAIMDIIESAHNRIVLISPFIDPSAEFYSTLRNASLRVSQIIIICLEKRLNNSVRNQLTDIPKVQVLDLKNIHAKCYYNEDKSIHTSLNLLLASELKNHESGTLYDGTVNRDLYLKSLELPETIVSEAIAQNTGKNNNPGLKYNRYQNRTFKIWNFEDVPGEKGTCIRCAKTLGKLNGYFSLCNKCYESWANFLNPDYEEKYCNWCGKSHPTSKNKPFCGACWNKYKNRNKNNSGTNRNIEEENPKNTTFDQKTSFKKADYQPNAKNNLKPERTSETESLTVSIGRIIGFTYAFLAKNYKLLLITIGIFLFVAFITSFLPGSKNIPEKTLSENTLKAIIRNYFRDVRLNHFNANNYFAPRTEKYFQITDITPAQINLQYQKNKNELIGSEFIIIDSTYVFSIDPSGNQTVGLWTYFSGFRKSKSQYEKERIKLEFAFDKNNKIIKMMESERKDIIFSYIK
jgi:hypothetical protein